MSNIKTSQEVGYTAAGEPGRQCIDCKNYQAKDENSGNCLGHEVAASGSCNYFVAK